jgi:CRP-like cAMP-binding protein
VQELLEKIKGSIQLSSEAEEYLLSLSKEKAVSKGDILLRQGQTVNKIYFVIDGCLRSFCTDKNGKEHTLQFAIKDWWMSDFIAIYSDESATLSVECLMDSTIIEFDAKRLTNIHSLFPDFEAFQRKNLERHVVSLQKRILNQLQLTALERYDLFLEQYPDVERYTPNYHIASYLGITQQSLSRIRVEKAGR